MCPRNERLRNKKITKAQHYYHYTTLHAVHRHRYSRHTEKLTSEILRRTATETRKDLEEKVQIWEVGSQKMSATRQH